MAEEEAKLLQPKRSAKWSSVSTAVSQKIFQVGEFNEGDSPNSTESASLDQSNSTRSTRVTPNSRTSPAGEPAPRDLWLQAFQMIRENRETKRRETMGDLKRHRGELSLAEKHDYDLSKAQLKASSRTSALLAGFAMIALVELQYDSKTPRGLLIVLGVVTTLLVSVHLLALMMSTCILPYMEAAGCTKDSPHKQLKFYIDLSWLFSTCIGLLLFLVEIGVIFFVKFGGADHLIAVYITTAMLALNGSFSVPIVVVFVVFSWLIHRRRFTHSLDRFEDKLHNLRTELDSFGDLKKSLKTNNPVVNA